MRNFTIAALISALVMAGCTSTSVNMRSAGIAYDRGDYTEAIELYEAELKDNPANAQAWYEVGQAYRIEGEYEKMSKAFDKSLEITDKYYNQIFDTRDSLWVRFFNQGVPLFNEKKYDEALKYFDKAVIVDSENPEGYRERGVCYLQMGEKDEAVKDFNTVIKADKEVKDLVTRINLALIYFQADDYEKASPLYEEVLKHDPENIMAISKLALIYQQQEKSEMAIKLYEKVTRTKKDDPDLWFNLGILYFQMGRYEEAFKSFNNVVDLNPDDVESLMNLVNSLWKVELCTEAIPYLERIVKLEPDNDSAWQFLVVAYTKAGRVKEGKAALDKYKTLKGISILDEDKIFLDKLKAEERNYPEYVKKMKNFPLEFIIEKNDEKNAWGRAQSWIGKYSSMKLQTATDYIIQTYNPPEGELKFGYYITKTPLDKGIQITVKCICGKSFPYLIERNAHILSYYIKTGEIVPELIH